MTVGVSLVKFLERKGYGVSGQNIFLFEVPNSLKTETEVLWIVTSGGQTVNRNRTGELIKNYQFYVYFRSTKAKRVDEVLDAMEKLFNCSSCVELEGYELVSLSANQYPTMQDPDSENRRFGFISIQMEVYEKCN